MSEAPWADDMILMPVPLRLAPQVAGFLADLKGARAESGNGPRTGSGIGEVVHVPGQGEWSQSMLNDLAENIPYTGVFSAP